MPDQQDGELKRRDPKSSKKPTVDRSLLWRSGNRNLWSRLFGRCRERVNRLLIRELISREERTDRQLTNRKVSRIGYLVLWMLQMARM